MSIEGVKVMLPHKNKVTIGFTNPIIIIIIIEIQRREFYSLVSIYLFAVSN